MDSPQDLLQQALTLPNGSRLKNRLAKSAMSEALGTTDNHATEALVRLYGRWAAGGIGLLITGNAMIDRRALGEPNNVAIEDDSDMPLLQRWAAAGQASGTQLWVQLNHPGRQSPKGLNAENVSPSAVPFSPALQAFFAPPRALTEDEIVALIQRFARSAGIVKRTGFSGVQIHAAHGYLISQFLSPLTNQRSDQWGGSAQNRRRFVLEVYRAMRAEVGAAFPIGIKLNSADFQQGGFSEDESLTVIQALHDEGIDLVELSGGTYEAPAMSDQKRHRASTLAREAYFLEFARELATIAQMPLMVTGGIRRLPVVQQVLDSGIAMAGIATALTLEPQLIKHWHEGRDLNPQLKPINWQRKPLAALATLAVVRDQMRRLSRGRLPDAKVAPWLALVRDQWFIARRTRQYRASMTQSSH